MGSGPWKIYSVRNRGFDTLLHPLLFLLCTSTLLVFTVTVLTPTLDVTFFIPFLRERNNTIEPAGASDGGHDSVVLMKLDYSDVDGLPEQLEHQITQLLGESSGSIRTKEDICPGRSAAGSQRNGSYSTLPSHKYIKDHAHTVFMPFMRRKLDSWQLELYYNIGFDPFWPKMRSLLKAWVEKRRFEPRIMQDLLRSVKGPIDQSYLGIREKNCTLRLKRYSRCAVVGNSGILLRNSYGALIDQHDMVMRINNAKTQGYERFVGTKTTISFVNSHILRGCAQRAQCWCHPYGNMVLCTHKLFLSAALMAFSLMIDHRTFTTILHLRARSCDRYLSSPTFVHLGTSCRLHFAAQHTFCSSAHKGPLLVTDPRFDSLSNRIAKWYSVSLFVNVNRRVKASWWGILRNSNRSFHYSSGMQAIILALGICDSVDAFGFGKGEGAKHHYHSRQRQELKDIHDYAAEYKFYDDLQKNHTRVIPFLAATGIGPLPTFKLFL